MKRTPEKLRRAIELRREGWATSEIAAEVGVTERSVKRWLPTSQYPLTSEQLVAAEERRLHRWREAMAFAEPPPPIPGVLWVRYRGAWLEARVDVGDWERFRDVRWHLAGKPLKYVSGRVQGSQRYLHRVILGLESEQGWSRQADHINRDRMDNRRANLRVVSPKENCANRGGLFEKRHAA